VIEKDLRPLRPPRISADPWRSPPDAPEPPRQQLEDESVSLLEPGALRERFAHARKAATRPQRWLADIVGRAPEPGPPIPQFPVEPIRGLAPAPPVEPRPSAPRHTEPIEPRHTEPIERIVPSQDYRLRDREQEMERRAIELRLRTERLEQREEEVVRREEAAARWFTDLSRAKKQLDEEKRRLQEPALTNGSPLSVPAGEWRAPTVDGWNDHGRLPPEPVE
jgi:hypothetical protein